MDICKVGKTSTRISKYTTSIPLLDGHLPGNVSLSKSKNVMLTLHLIYKNDPFSHNFDMEGANLMSNPLIAFNFNKLPPSPIWNPIALTENGKREILTPSRNHWKINGDELLTTKIEKKIQYK